MNRFAKSLMIMYELVKLFKEKYGALKCTHYILLKIVTIAKP